MSERGRGRVILFLQGPHGPFFHDLAAGLRATGATVLKAGINRADDREWGRAGPYQPFTGPPGRWPDWITALIAERGVTEIALYGDTRPHHAAAARLARARPHPSCFRGRISAAPLGHL